MRPTRAILGIAAAALLVAGCSSGSGAGSAVASAPGANGIEKKSATEIVTAAQAAAKAATAVHVAGNAGGTVLDVRVGTDAAHATITTDGQTVELLRLGTDHYLKGDAAYWAKEGGAAAAAKLAGKWVKIGSQLAQQYEQFLTVETFFADLGTGDPMVKGDQATVDGVQAITVKDTKDDSLLYVSMVAKPLPLKATSPASDGGSVTFTDWNVPITDLVAPPADQVVDITAQTGG